MIRSTSGNAPQSFTHERQAPVVVEVVTDPIELARSRAQWARFDRNAAWLQARASEVYSKNRGKYICIAGEELFAADSAKDVLSLARAAHPDDDGLFVRFIPAEKLDRIYAHRR
jgi:hypothetical protein